MKELCRRSKYLEKFGQKNSVNWKIAQIFERERTLYTPALRNSDGTSGYPPKVVKVSGFFYLQQKPTGQALSCCWWLSGKFFLRPLDDLVGQSHSNKILGKVCLILGRFFGGKS